MTADERLRCFAAGAETRRAAEDAYDTIQRIEQAKRDGYGNVVTSEAAHYRAIVEQFEWGVENAKRCGEASTPNALGWIGRWEENKARLQEAHLSGQFPQADLYAQLAEWADVLSTMASDFYTVAQPTAPQSVPEPLYVLYRVEEDLGQTPVRENLTLNQVERLKQEMEDESPGSRYLYFQQLG